MTPARRHWFHIFILAGLLSVGLAACGFDLSGGLASKQTDTLRHLTILYTNDEHGWMDGYQNTGGSAGMAYKWRDREGWSEDGAYLILSGGDMWTGHALSTFWEGESMTEVMNAMGYDAAAIGNHDFDFGLDALRARSNQSEFPFLSANIRESDTGEFPDFALPYYVTEVNAVRVGVIGLTTTETKVDTQPAHVAGIDFLPYADSLPDIAQQARANGAELLLVIGHVCGAETRALAPMAANLGITFIGGGHCHEEINEVVDGVRLIESGFFNRGYTRIDLLFDTELSKTVEMESQFVSNKAGRGDEEIERIMEEWRARTDSNVWEVIGYADPGIDRKSPEMAKLLLEPWLAAWPSANVALASSRYVQQDLFQGDISPGTIMGLLSTTNELVEISITGNQLIETIETHRPLSAGLIEDQEGYRLTDGRRIEPELKYRVIVPEALYGGGNYYKFYQFDSNPSHTGINWRQPIIEWLRSVGSTEQKPINKFLSDL